MNGELAFRWQFIISPSSRPIIRVVAPLLLAARRLSDARGETCQSLFGPALGLALVR